MKAFQNKLLDARGKIGWDQRTKTGMYNSIEQSASGVNVEFRLGVRDLEGKHAAQDDSERINIARFGVVRSAKHFGGSVDRGADHGHISAGRGHKSRSPKIGNFSGKVGIDEDVFSFQVSVDDGWHAFVEILHASSSIGDELQTETEWKRSVRGIQ